MMENAGPLKRMLFDYIMVVVEITLSVALIGSVYARDTQITYSYFFLPFILGAVCMIPCLIIYLNERLTVKQVMIQRGIQLVTLEAVVLLFVYFLVGKLPGAEGYIVIAISVVVIDVGTYLLAWYYEKDEADKLNEKIKKSLKNRK